MGLQHLPPTSSSAAVADALRADGACIVDDLAPAELLDSFMDELQPWLDDTPTGMDDFTGHNTRRTGALISRCPSAYPLIQHPLILGATKDLLEGATSFQLHLTQVIAVGPDSPSQGLHRDQWAFDFFSFPTGYDVQLNTIWAATDFTEENGATRVVPGSNTVPDGATYTHDDTVGAVMSRGSVLVYSGSVYHGAGENRSDEVRVGINLTYARSWLRQEENQYLSIPPEMVADLPDDLLRLAGWARGAYALGYVDNLRDPLDAARGRGRDVVTFAL
jgi:hypothetical protein